MEMLNEEDRARMVQAIVNRRRWVVDRFGYADEFSDLVRTAVVEAELAWDPEGGRTLASWAWICGEWEAGHIVRRLCRRVAAVEGAPAPMPTPAADETLIQVKRALAYMRAALPDREWQLLWMRHAEGYQSCEIAARLGISPNKARKKIFEISGRARNILATHGIVGV